MGTTKPGSEVVLSITRTIEAPPERVFRAWIEPGQLKQWWGVADGYTTPVAEVDLRVGGRYRLAMQPPDQEALYIVGGVFREVHPPRRLVYTWAWEGEEGLETVVTVEFRAAGTATEVVLTHEQFTDAGSRDRHLAGWTGCLDRLARLVEASR